MLTLVKNNAIFLGAYIGICFGSVYFELMREHAIYHMKTDNIRVITITIMLVTLAILFICFIAGRFLGSDVGSITFNILSSVSILVFLIIVVLLLLKADSPSLPFVANLSIAPVFSIIALLSELFVINQTICIVICIFLPYIAFTIGAATK